VTGLAAAFAFEEGTGTSTADASGNGHTGLLSGPSWMTTGKSGRALSFDGQNDVVTVPDSSLLHPTAGLTLEAWVYPTTSGAGWRTLIMKEQPGDETWTIYASSNTNVPSVGVRIGGVLEIVRGPLPIPAGAEIAIEGEIPPPSEEARAEGPFGEWPGYYSGGTIGTGEAQPVIRVKAIYHRNDPILCGFPLLKPSSGDNQHFSLMRSALIWNALDEAGVPDVQAVWAHPSGGRFMTVLAIKQRYPGHARQAALIASQCRAAALLTRYVVVVDEDIDIWDSNELLWALCTRTDPVKDIEILRRCWSNPIDPIIPPSERGFQSRGIIDACRPYEWMKDFPAVSGASAELKEKVIKKFGASLAEKR
jgi:3-polyprenyl-4-hydroxybenzoate decarboxylase